MAIEYGRENGLRAIDATHLFASNVTRLAVRRGAYLRSYSYDFILQFALCFALILKRRIQPLPFCLLQFSEQFFERVFFIRR